MAQDQFQRMAEVFEQAWRAPPEQRAAFLADACGTDKDLLSRVSSLLAHLEDSGDALRSDWLSRAAEADPDLRIGLAPLLGRKPPEGTQKSDGSAARPDPFRVAPLNSDHRFPPSTVTPRLSKAPGGAIGRYELIEKLGEGGFGTVHRARQTSPVVREVALKVIRAGMDTREIIARFEAERQALALMDHPGIAKVFDAGSTDEGRPYFVMELVQGSPITAYCQCRKLGIRERLTLFVQVCHAVQHAHQKGIIHRDIKPSNVLVVEQDGRPSPKIIDFGIAKATQQTIGDIVAMTQDGQFIGTPTYMSPEQANRRSLDIDTRSDIYSLGVLLYELLSGATPFAAGLFVRGGLEDMLRHIREVEPPLPSAHAPALRGELDWIIMRCLEKDRSRRYQSANALADDIERHLRHEPVLAGPQSSIYRFRKLIRRNRGAFAAFSAVAAMLLVAVIGTTWGLFQARDQRDLAVTARKAETEARELADRQRVEAERQTEIANAVTRFLTVDLLGGDNPARAESERDERISDVLARAEERVDSGALKEQPRVEASVRSVIGDIHHSLGRIADSERNLKRAFELRLAEVGYSNPDTIMALSALAAVQLDAGRFGECLENYERAYKLDQQYPVKYEDARAVLCGGYGQVLCEFGRFDDAESVFRQALSNLDAIKVPTNNHRRFRGIILSNMNRVARGKKDFAGAISYCDQALEVFRSVLGEEHQTIATAINDKALAYKLTGNLEAAEPLYRQALDMRLKVLPENHPEIAQSLNNLASLLRDRGDFKEAESLYRETLKAMKLSLPPGHYQHALVRRNLGNCLVRQGRFKKAEAEFQKVYDQLSKIRGLPPEHLHATVEAFVKLYDAWALAEPQSDAGIQAAAWREKLSPAEQPKNASANRNE